MKIEGHTLPELRDLAETVVTVAAAASAGRGVAGPTRLPAPPPC